MDSLISQVMALSKKKDWNGVHHTLDRGHEILIKSPLQYVDRALEVLMDDPASYTMAIIWIASGRVGSNDDNATKVAVRVFELLAMRGDYRQVNGNRKVMGMYRVCVREYTELCRQLGAQRRGIKYLTEGMKHFRPTSDHLTPCHPAILQLHLKNDDPLAALKLVSSPIYEISPDNTGANALDYMSYYYYAALAHCAVQDWEKATLCFDDCLSVPAHAVSMVMVAAYRTYMMVGIIANGRAPSMPRALSGGNERLLKQICGDYIDLASALEKRNEQNINKAFAAAGNAFGKDNMMGFVQQAMEATSRNTIIALTRTYVTLSLDQISKEVGSTPDSIEHLLREMIWDGSISAVIDKKSGTVSFDRSSQELDIRDVEALIEKVSDLTRRVSDADDDTQVSHAYVMQKLRNQPNLRELLQEYDTKRRQNRGLGGMMADIMRQTVN